MDFAVVFLLYLQYELVVLYLLAISMFVIGLVVFVILLWLPAPYGRYSQTGKFLRSGVSPHLGWFLQEFPSFFIPTLIIGSSLMGITQHKFTTTQLSVLGCFVLHYFIRSVLLSATFLKFV